MVEFRCPADDVDPTDGCNATPRLGATTVSWRRCDWGSNGNAYYQCTDSYLADDSSVIVQTYAFSLNGPFNAANGDGGQLVDVDAASGNITALSTQDGGTPGMQWFVGAKCGGQGWVIAELSLGLAYATWTATADKLAISADPNACPGMGSALDAWESFTVSYPFQVNGQMQLRTIPTLISEHFDHADPTQSVYMERSFFGQLYGLLRWEAWASPATGATPPADLAQRCPATSLADDYQPPLAGWILYDCRNWTNIMPVSGWSGDAYGWP
jgi:hypothetical protein